MINKMQKFVEQMQTELEANKDKGDWEKFINRKEIHSEISHHLFKLQIAESMVNKEKIKEHIADCANLLLMLGNSYELYER